MVKERDAHRSTSTWRWVLQHNMAPGLLCQESQSCHCMFVLPLDSEWTQSKYHACLMRTPSTKKPLKMLLKHQNDTQVKIASMKLRVKILTKAIVMLD